MLGIAYAALAWQQLRYGIEYDEGSNLTVVRNFAEGGGYASTGLLPWMWSKPFDPGASTGPTLLVPGSFAWFISDGSLEFARIVPLAFFGLLVICLSFLFGKLAGPFAAVIAAASPLLLSVAKADISTVSLVPGRFVGEIAATACLVLMALMLASSRPLLVGVAGGLAIQAKVHFLLPVIVLGVMWLVLESLADRRPRLQGMGLVLFGVILPTLLFEAFRFSQLGVEGYVVSVKDYAAWLLGQGSAPAGDSFLSSAGRRLGGLLSVYSMGGALILAACIAILVACGLVRVRSQSQVGASESESRALTAIAALASAALAIFGWWMFLPPEKLPRVGIPVLLILTPMVLVAGFMTLRSGWLSSASGPVVTVSGAASVFLSVCLGGLVLWQGWTAFTNDFGARMLSEQRAAAEVIRGSGTASIPMEWIWNLAQFQILADVPAETLPGVSPPTVQVFDAIRARTDFGVDDARAFIPLCDQVLFSSQSSVVCSTSPAATR